MDSDPSAPFAEQMLKAVATYARTIEEVRGMIRFGETIDRDRLLELQSKYADYIEKSHLSGPSKYLDIAHWIALKYQIISKLGLAQGPKQSILDLGMGAGHFIAIAQHYGHDTIGIDIEGPPLYTEIGDLLGVERTIQRLYRQTPLPDFERKFNLVTAQMVSFNSIRDNIPRVYWEIEDWQYFINDVIDNQLIIPGRIFLILNRNVADNGSHYADVDLLGWFEDNGAVVDQNTGEVDIQIRERVRYGKGSRVPSSPSSTVSVTNGVAGPASIPPPVAASGRAIAVASPLVLTNNVVPWSMILAPGYEPPDISHCPTLIGKTFATPGGQAPDQPVPLRLDQSGLVLPGPGAHCLICSLGAFKVLVRGNEDDDQFAIEMCRLVSDNVVHSRADAGLCRVNPGSWPFFVDRLSEKFFFSDQPLALHCFEIACFTAYVLSQAGYKTRRISLVNSQGHGGHIVLEVFLPVAARWAYVDPDYGVMLRSPNDGYVGSVELRHCVQDVRIEFLSHKSWLSGEFWNFAPGFRGQFTWAPEKSRTTPTVDAERYKRLLSTFEKIVTHDFVFRENFEISVTSCAQDLGPLPINDPSLHADSASAIMP